MYGAKRLFYCSNKLEKLHNHPHKSLIMNGINEKIKIPSTIVISAMNSKNKVCPSVFHNVFASCF
jgi:hypothetical protein